MAANPLFGNKKRDSGILYGMGRAHENASPARGHTAMVNDCYKYPPSKRSRKAQATDDPFSDHEDFTADDLEEIDILASQAYTQEPGPAYPPSNHVHSKAVPQNEAPSTMPPPALQRLKHSHWKEPPDSCGGKDDFNLGVLQAQHEELKQKMKELNDELLVKNGEIKVLRDSLRQTETSLEQQKVSHMKQEKETAQVQSERERELSKKMQSLQSELQFKDAEMNELRSKLQTCERSTKVGVPPVSPRSPSRSLKPESCSSPHPGRSSFPTKESFIAEMTPRPPSSAAHPATGAPGIKAENDRPDATAKRTRTCSSVFYKQKNNGQGSVLLNALMQQPISPGSLGLCHLLSSNTVTTLGSPARCTHTSSTTNTSSSSVMSPARCSALQDAQQLAITGLNSIAMSEDAAGPGDSQSSSGLLHLNKMSRLPGAVHILPLLDYHITAYCQALQNFEKSVGGPSENQSIASSSTERSAASSVEDPIATLVDTALASLGILYHLVFYSLEVVNTLLQSTSDKRTLVASTTEQDSRILKPTEMADDEQSQHPLFKKLVQTLFSTVVTCQRDLVRKQTLKVLVKLAENATSAQLSSFHSLFSRPALLQCLSPDSPLSVAHLTIRLLAVLTDHQKLANLMCSCSESCVLLALYTYVISRPDKAASGSLWLQLEHEVVRFLIKVSVQGSSSPTAVSGTTCRCNREVVKALVLALHQEWLSVRRLTRLPLHPAGAKVIQFLRDTVLLLHGLSQKDKNFSEHCLEVLHQYDQAVPGVRAVFRKLQVLRESEEFALDELCPPEAETEDEYMDCT